MIKIKRIYDPPSPDDGYRVLIDRLWPRGLARDAARLDAWARELAVSDDLRRWFGHDPAKWEEFRARYRAELLAPEKRPLLAELAERARQGTVTILYAAREERYNNAQVLREVLEELLASSSGQAGTQVPHAGSWISIRSSQASTSSWDGSTAWASSGEAAGSGAQAAQISPGRSATTSAGTTRPSRRAVSCDASSKAMNRASRRAAGAWRVVAPGPMARRTACRSA
jgi:uncharacterized protein YeaO (DUF488 family)